MVRNFLAFLAIALMPCGIFVFPAGAQRGPEASVAQAKSELASEFSNIKRIYVESLGNDSASKQMQALLIDALTSSKRFIATENKARADAILKGVGTAQSSHELHSTSEGTLVGNVRAVGGISDSSTSTETINHAHLTIRLVSPDGDVLWSTEKESTGGKYKGAAADVADQAVKQLLDDLGQSN